MPGYNFRDDPRSVKVRVDSKGKLRPTQSRIEIEPREETPEDKLTAPPVKVAVPTPVDRESRMLSEGQKKTRRLQRA